MKYVLGIGIAGFLWIVLFGKIYLHIQYQKDAVRDHFSLQILLFQWLRIYHLQRENFIASLVQKQLARLLPPAKQPQVAKKATKASDSFWRKLLRLKQVRPACLHLVVERLSCRVRIATEDAGVTALLFGTWQSLQALALRWLHCQAAFAVRPEICVIPDFQKQKQAQEVFFDCIVTAKIGNIIRMLNIYMKMYWREKHE